LQTAKRRYYRWVEQGVIDRIFEAVSDDPDIEWLASVGPKKRGKGERGSPRAHPTPLF
jgi:ribosomal protein L15E